MVGRVVARNWEQFRSLNLHLEIHPGWLALAGLAVFLTYAIQVESWRRVLAGWGQRLPFGPAARTWCLANMGRYVPGKVWSVAGLVFLAQRVGVPGSVATASAFANLALALGTGTAVGAAATPAAVGVARLAAGLLVALGTLGVLVWPLAARQLGRLMNAGWPLPPLPLSAVLAGGILMLLSWVTYGIAFWLLAQGLLPRGSLPIETAVGTFALGYILGMLALFAPGGVGVRELALVSLLTPVVGGGGALALSVGSRALLTLAEASAALASLALVRRRTPGEVT